MSDLDQAAAAERLRDLAVRLNNDADNLDRYAACGRALYAPDVLQKLLDAMGANALMQALEWIINHQDGRQTLLCLANADKDLEQATDLLRLELLDQGMVVGIAPQPGGA